MQEQMSPRLSELPEDKAEGRIKEIYEEIRRLSGVPMVALIYRHMASLPGVLEWAWEQLQPLMASGVLQEEAWKLADQAELPATPAIPRVALSAVGIQRADEEGIRASLAAFNRSNPVNMLALRCLSLRLSASVTTAPCAERAWTPPAMLPALPPMRDPADIDPSAREVTAWLSHRKRGRYAGIWPSLYRYLANWPRFFGFAAVILPPHFDAIDAAVVRMGDAVEQAARELARHGGNGLGAPPSGEACWRLQAAIGNFTMLIPEMVVMGKLLERALPPIDAV